MPKNERMIHVKFPESSGHRLVYYLSVEEFVAEHIAQLLPGEPKGGREAFFMWQVPPTVIFGRNQVMEAEVNMEYCQEKGIQLYRRKSGGGCVYSDWGNIMLSYISDSTDVAFTFDKYLQRVALSLRQLGLKAERSGRNDVLVDGKKVSGNSFFLLPSSSVVHGTMLFDSDFDELQRAITPSDSKIQSKGVASVRQHVTNVREALSEINTPLARECMDIEAFKRHLLRSFCREGEEITLTQEQLREVDRIEATYLEPSFLQGRHHVYSIERQGRIEGVGEVTVSMDLEGECIKSVRLGGDFFEVKPGLCEVLSKALQGRRNERSEVREALSRISVDSYIMGLSSEALINLIYKNNQ